MKNLNFYCDVDLLHVKIIWCSKFQGNWPKNLGTYKELCAVLNCVQKQTRKALGRAHTSATKCLIHKNILGPMQIHYVFTPFLSAYGNVTVCLCAGYLKKLWTDSNENWWTGWVCDKDELIRFW